MATLNNATKTAVNTLTALYGTPNFEVRGKDIIWAFAGPDARFDRQLLMEHFSGQKLPLAKCGVNALWEMAERFCAELAATPDLPQVTGFVAETATAPAPPKVEIPMEIGLKVIRHCGTEGEITGIDNTFRKVIVTLSTGSVRKPSFKRFQKLYTLPK